MTVSYLSFSPYCEHSVLSLTVTQSFCRYKSAGHESLLLNGANFESSCCIRVVVFVSQATRELFRCVRCADGYTTRCAAASGSPRRGRMRERARALGWWGELIVCDDSHWADLNQGSSCAPLTAILLPKIYALWCRGSVGTLGNQNWSHRIRSDVLSIFHHWRRFQRSILINQVLKDSYLKFLLLPYSQNIMVCKCLAETVMNGKPQRAKCNAEIWEFTIRFIRFYLLNTTRHYTYI